MSDKIIVALEQNQGHALEMLKEKNKHLFLEKTTQKNRKRVRRTVFID
ncbi:MAG: hypothetical protein P8M03_00520 [Flavobacteriaceae bacterium]|nr:hypothetical protein [Flavobacteriaceae bacterium]